MQEATMKHLVLVGILTGALAGLAYAQEAPTQAPPKAEKKAAQKSATTRAAAADVLGTITLPKDVKANGETLKKGTYQVRLSDEEVKPAPGTDPGAEKWVEFAQGGKVKGKEVASIVPNGDIKQMTTEDKQTPPPAGKARVQLLKQKDYYRVWISKGGTSYLIHLPPA
jgi:hypothetical protein